MGKGEKGSGGGRGGVGWGAGEGGGEAATAGSQSLCYTQFGQQMAVCVRVLAIVPNCLNSGPSSNQIKRAFPLFLG